MRYIFAWYELVFKIKRIIFQSGDRYLANTFRANYDTLIRMKYRKLGSSDLNVSAIGLGTWGLGGPPFWEERDEGKAIATIQRAIDLGVNFIDTAPIYGFGRAEEIIGKAIAGRRDKVILATKCGLRWKAESLGEMYRSLSPASIYEELENSLRRLNTSYIDLYQIHWPDPQTPLEHSMVALVMLQAMGKIREIGISNFDVEMVEKASGYCRITSSQSKYNVLEREIEGNLLPYCVEHEIGVLAYSPLASGLLTGKYNQSHKFTDWRGKKNFGLFRDEQFAPAMRKIQKMQDFISNKPYSLADYSIQWLLNQKGVSSALVGANSAEQVETNIKALEVVIPIEHIDNLNDIYKSG